MIPEGTNIIYIHKYIESQKKANHKYYEANKEKLLEKRRNKLQSLKANPELYEQYLIKKREVNNKSNRLKKLKKLEEQKQQEDIIQ
jgi:putative NADPH-quinone reductase